MQVIYLGLVGVIGGIIGGMGMGGGTLLIPLLCIFFSVGQKTAQAINLVAFIPMAILALIIHLKNKMVKFEHVLLIILVGTVSCVLGCYIAKIMSGDLLKRLFGGFLFLLSIYQFVSQIKDKKE